MRLHKMRRLETLRLWQSGQSPTRIQVKCAGRSGQATRGARYSIDQRKGKQMGSSEWSQPERRRYPRRTTAIQLELRPGGSTAPIHAETTDICAIGCYVEMSITLEAGSSVSMVLWLGEEKLIAEGKVITRHPQFGN